MQCRDGTQLSRLLTQRGMLPCFVPLHNRSSCDEMIGINQGTLVAKVKSSIKRSIACQCEIGVERCTSIVPLRPGLTTLHNEGMSAVWKSVRTKRTSGLHPLVLVLNACVHESLLVVCFLTLAQNSLVNTILFMQT
jgi:hypothetical protein